MPSIFQSFKDSKRRITQKVRNATGKRRNSDSSIGQSVLTSDDDFEKLYNQYIVLEKNLKKLIEHSQSYINNVDKWCEANSSLYQDLDQFISSNQINDSEEMNEFKQNISDVYSLYKNEYIHTRKYIIDLIQSRIVQRIEDFIKEGGNNMDTLYKQRKNILLDYDSHLRKASVYENKNEDVQYKRFQMKSRHDKAMLDEFTSYLTKRLTEYLTVGTKLLIEENATLITCEMFLVKKQYDMISEVGNNVGEDIVFSVLHDLEIIENENSYSPPPTGLSSHPESEYPVFVSFNDYIKQLAAKPKKKVVKKVKKVVKKVKKVEKGEVGDTNETGENGENGETVSHESTEMKVETSEKAQHKPIHKKVKRKNSIVSKADSNLVSLEKSEGEQDSIQPNTSSFVETGEVSQEPLSTNPDNEEMVFDFMNEVSEQPADSSSLNWMDDLQNWGSVETTSDPVGAIWNIQSEANEEDDFVIGMKVKALYPCQTDEEGDLQFKEGDIITVTSFFAEGWWLGECNGMSGIFPSNYVERV